MIVLLNALFIIAGTAPSFASANIVNTISGTGVKNARHKVWNDAGYLQNWS